MIKSEGPITNHVTLGDTPSRGHLGYGNPLKVRLIRIKLVLQINMYTFLKRHVLSRNVSNWFDQPPKNQTGFPVKSHDACCDLSQRVRLSSSATLLQRCGIFECR